MIDLAELMAQANVVSGQLDDIKKVSKTQMEVADTLQTIAIGTTEQDKIIAQENQKQQEAADAAQIQIEKNLSISPDDPNNLIAAYTTAIATNRKLADAYVENISAKKEVNFWDNPFKWISAQASIPHDQDMAATYEGKVAHYQEALQNLNITRKQTGEMTKDAAMRNSAEENFALAKRIELIAKGQEATANEKNLDVKTEALKTMASGEATKLQNLLSLFGAQNELLRMQEEKAYRDYMKKEAKDEKRGLEDIAADASSYAVNVLGQSPVPVAYVKAAPEQFVGMAIKWRELAGGRMALADTTGEAIVTLTNQGSTKDTPATKSLKELKAKIERDMTAEGIKITPEAVANRLNAELYKTDPKTKKEVGVMHKFLKDMEKATDGTSENPYTVPDIRTIFTASPGFAEHNKEFTKDVIEPLMAAGVNDSSTETLYKKVAEQIRSSKLPYDQREMYANKLISGLTSFYSAGAVHNNATRGYTLLGMKNITTQTGYNANGVNWLDFNQVADKVHKENILLFGKLRTVEQLKQDPNRADIRRLFGTWQEGGNK